MRSTSALACARTGRDGSTDHGDGGAIDSCAGYEIHNLGESATTSLSELVGIVGEACGAQPVLDRQPLQPGDVLITFADISKARAKLGYDPRTPVREGLGRFVRWYRESSG